MSDFAKGAKPRDLEGAKGGPTLGRVRDFYKGDRSETEIGPLNKQDYSSKGSPAKRTGDKSLSMK